MSPPPPRRCGGSSSTWSPALDDAGDAKDEWRLVKEAVRPGDGATVRRWAKAMYDVPNQLEHTQDRYDVIRDDEIVDSEYQTRSEATRWYTQQQAADLFSVAGLSDVHLVSAFTDHPASAADNIFSVFGMRPVQQLAVFAPNSGTCSLTAT